MQLIKQQCPKYSKNSKQKGCPESLPSYPVNNEKSMGLMYGIVRSFASDLNPKN